MGLISGRNQHGYSTSAGTSSSEPTGLGTATDARLTSAKVKESASGVKGLAAAVHGAGETIRGNLNASVDRAFNDVCAAPFSEDCEGGICPRMRDTSPA
jgi:hypothetical protein